ncbi:MAG: hypothetical protein FJ291_03815 [Planctomycetes bacterium]|nr:hypothetical protein [Planctomycetota bacterium]
MWVAVRFVVYTLVAFGFTRSLSYVTRHDGTAAFAENGPIEWLQFSILLATSATFLAGCRAAPAFRAMWLILACGPAFAAGREMDKVLDSWLPVVGWKVAWAFPVAAVVVAYRNRGPLRRQAGQFMGSRAVAMLWAGFVIAVPIAQLIGHRPFLRAVMGASYTHNYRRLIEEASELVGYLVLLAGAIEGLVQMRAAGRVERE